MWRTKLFQYSVVVVVLVDLPLVIDPTASRKKMRKKREGKGEFSALISKLDHDRAAVTWFLPHILISAAHSKLVCLCRVHIDGVQTHFLIALLHYHQFTATYRWGDTMGTVVHNMKDLIDTDIFIINVISLRRMQFWPIKTKNCFGSSNVLFFMSTETNVWSFTVNSSNECKRQESI